MWEKKPPPHPGRRRGSRDCAHRPIAAADQTPPSREDVAVGNWRVALCDCLLVGAAVGARAWVCQTDAMSSQVRRGVQLLQRRQMRLTRRPRRDNVHRVALVRLLHSRGRQEYRWSHRSTRWCRRQRPWPTVPGRRQARAGLVSSWRGKARLWRGIVVPP